MKFATDDLYKLFKEMSPALPTILKKNKMPHQNVSPHPCILEESSRLTADNAKTGYILSATHSRLAFSVVFDFDGLLIR